MEITNMLMPVPIHQFAIHHNHHYTTATSPSSPQQPIKFLNWKRPSFGYAAINCDGSFRARNGTCGYGIVVRDHLGRLIMGKAAHLPKSELDETTLIGSRDRINYGITVLMVEMMAIRDGLRLARKLEIRRVEIQSDSKSAISILSGNSKCPTECVTLLSHIRAEMSFFSGPVFLFVYRERNRAADFLSKFLTRDGQVCFDASEMPHAFQRIIIEDALGFATVRF